MIQLGAVWRAKIDVLQEGEPIEFANIQFTYTLEGTKIRVDLAMVKR